MIDFLIVVFYLVIIMMTALRVTEGKNTTAESYFLSNRGLKWYSISLSTIATNVSGYQFLGMMGSAYLYGLAQANLEINAVQGILIATFIFVPLFLREKITTITEFIALKLGQKIALFYTFSNMALFSTITLGAALFWGAYAADMVFAIELSFLHENRIIRIAILIIFLAIFSAVYTYYGGLSAVVRTDIIQFSILMISGIVVCFIAVKNLGGWNQLYAQVPDKMHLHLPADHSTLPWTHLFGLFFLNINYWCANQTVMQRAIAAKSLSHAQTGLMMGGLIKYLMAIIIVVPGIALYGILGDGLGEPDLAFPYIVKNYLPVGIKGLVLCGLFASLMSTLDSTFNSLATLWSIDIYSKYINKKATDGEKINAGKRAIVFCLFSGLTMGLVLLYLKFDKPDSAFTHTLNNLRYFINCGIVVLICSTVIFVKPKTKIILLAFIATLPVNLFLQSILPEMNYFVRAFWVVFCGLSLAVIFNFRRRVTLGSITKASNLKNLYLGILLLFSLILLHILFH